MRRWQPCPPSPPMPAGCVPNLLSIKSFHGTVAGNIHECALSSRIGKVSQLLTTIQKRLLHHQVEAFLDGCSTCPDCGTPLKAKGYQSRSFRPLFDTLKLPSPRLFHCRCRRRKTTSFRPLS